jgi:nucleotide-binding universal stress UspA family protein
MRSACGCCGTYRIHTGANGIHAALRDPRARSGGIIDLMPDGWQAETKIARGAMFARILVAIDDVSQVRGVVDMVKDVADPGQSQVRVLHLRLREVSGFRWYSRETSKDASLIADAATFELRMAGLAAGGGVRYAAVDRVAEAIVAEAKAFDADLIVLGRPARGELLTRLLGSVTLRVIRRSNCPVLVAQPWRGGTKKAMSPGASTHESQA